MRIENSESRIAIFDPRSSILVDLNPRSSVLAATAAQDPSIAVVFKRPFDEQVAFFRGKLGNLVPTQTWRDVQGAAHDRGFMVAGAGKADLLADLAGAVDKAVTEGETLQAFRARFGEIVQRHGWHGWTGEGTPAALSLDPSPSGRGKGEGFAWRTRVIYQTNLTTSYAAGRLAQLQKGDYPYWMYKHSPASREPRPEHVAWDGLVLPSTHEFFQRHKPPYHNGVLEFGCKCRLVGVRSPAQAKRLGGNPDKQLPAGWDAGELPDDFQPGNSVSEAVRVAAQKTMKWEYRLAEAFMKNVPSTQRDAIASAIRNQPETAEAVRRYARRVLEKIEADVPQYQTLGLLTSAESAHIANLTGIEALTRDVYDYALDADIVRHIKSGHTDPDEEVPRGQRPVTAADYARLLEIISTTPTLSQRKAQKTKLPVVLFEKVIAGERFGARFEVRRDRRMLALKTLFVIPGKGQASP